MALATILCLASSAAFLRAHLRRTAQPRHAAVRLQDRDHAFDALQTLDTVVTRTLDTIEDAWLLAQRIQAEQVDAIDCLSAWEDATDERPRLLVIGSGWGAHALTKVIDAERYRLLVVSPRNFFVFTPMLAASSVGTVEYRSITEPMRAANPRAAFIEGTVADMEPLRRTALLKIDGGGIDDGTERTVEYDIAVVACGVRSSVGGVPGVSEHCCFLKEIQACLPCRIAQTASGRRLADARASCHDARRTRRSSDGRSLGRSSAPLSRG